MTAERIAELRELCKDVNLCNIRCGIGITDCLDAIEAQAKEIALLNSLLALHNRPQNQSVTEWCVEQRQLLAAEKEHKP